MCKYKVFDDVPLETFNFSRLQNRQAVFVLQMLFVLKVYLQSPYEHTYKFFTTEINEIAPKRYYHSKTDHCSQIA